MNGTLRSSAVHGVTWLGISHGVGRGLHFVGTIFLARLLFPEDFGIVAMATVITGFVMEMEDLGFGEAIIQRKEVTDSHLSTAFWAQMAIGIMLCIVTVAISPLAAGFFRNELVSPVLAVSSLAFVIAPLRSVHGSLLRKRLQFLRFSIGEIGQGATFLAVATVMAFAGSGVWSIVLGNLAGQIAFVILRWTLCRWRPTVQFSIASLKDMWRFGFNLTGSRIVQSLSQRLDYLIIGRFLTAASLGFYNLSYRIASFPTTGLGMSVGRIAFPTFSLVQDETERLRRGFIKSLSYVSLVIFPLFSGLAIVAPEFIKVVFGTKWTPSVLPFQLLCITGAVMSFHTTLIQPIIRSKGRPDVELKLNLARIVLIGTAVFIGVRFGATGVAMSVSTVSIITWLVLQVFVNRFIGISARHFLASLRPAVFGSLIMTSTLLLTRYLVAQQLSIPDAVLLSGSVFLGTVVFFATLKVTRTKALDEMMELLFEMIRPLSKSMAERIPSLKKRKASSLMACHVKKE